MVHTFGCIYENIPERVGDGGRGDRDLRDQGLASLSSEEDTSGALSDRNGLRKKSGTGAHSFNQSGHGRHGGVMGTYRNLPVPSGLPGTHVLMSKFKWT